MERAVRIDLRFGARLRRAMAEKDMSAKALADQLKVGRGTVTRWRKGECPDDLRYPHLAAALGVDEGWLRQGDGEEPKDTTMPPGRTTRPPEASSAALPPSGAGEPPEIARLRSLERRLAFFKAQLAAYRTMDESPGPAVIAEWLEILADLEEARRLTPPGGYPAPPTPHQSVR